MSVKKNPTRCYVYMLECSDGTYYTGSTVDLAQRITAHNGTSQGAKYTRGRRPVRLVWKKTCKDLSAALKAEYAIKKLSRRAKELLVKKAAAGTRQNRKAEDEEQGLFCGSK